VGGDWRRLLFLGVVFVVVVKAPLLLLLIGEVGVAFLRIFGFEESKFERSCKLIFVLIIVLVFCTHTKEKKS
jgi:hypothetical protein